MSTCLFPYTTDPARLEQLCRVPPGTAARLAALEAEQAVREAAIPPRTPGEGPDYRDKCRSREEHLYPAVDADKDLRNYSNFLLFGWGRVQNATYDALGLTDAVIGPGGDGGLDDGKTDGSVHAGDCTDRERCVAALVAQATYSNRLRVMCGLDGAEQKIFELAEGLKWG